MRANERIEPLLDSALNTVFLTETGTILPNCRDSSIALNCEVTDPSRCGAALPIMAKVDAPTPTVSAITRSAGQVSIMEPTLAVQEQKLPA